MTNAKQGRDELWFIFVDKRRDSYKNEKKKNVFTPKFKAASFKRKHNIFQAHNNNKSKDALS